MESAPRLARANTICRALEGDSFEPALQAHILNSDAVCAYAFAPGDVFVTRGLMDRATDDQLAAAIAHEMGHLISDGKTRDLVAIRGTPGAHDAEARADAIGCQILLAHHIPSTAMIHMLQLVSDTNPLCRCDLERRIALLKRLPND